MLPTAKAKLKNDRPSSTLWQIFQTTNMNTTSFSSLPYTGPEGGHISPSSILPSFRFHNLIYLLAVYLVLDIVYNCTLHPLRNVPGPFLAKFSQSWRNIRYFRGSWHEDIVQLHRQYGDVVRIAPNEISFVNVAALKELYGHGKQVLKVRNISHAEQSAHSPTHALGQVVRHLVDSQHGC